MVNQDRLLWPVDYNFLNILVCKNRLNIAQPKHFVDQNANHYLALIFCQLWQFLLQHFFCSSTITVAELVINLRVDNFFNADFYFLDKPCPYSLKKQLCCRFDFWKLKIVGFNKLSWELVNAYR